MGLYSDREDSLTFKFVNDGESTDLYTFSDMVMTLLAEHKKVSLKKLLGKEALDLLQRIAGILVDNNVVELEGSGVEA